MKHAIRRRQPRHALRGRDLQREYRQAVAIADAVYQQWVDGTATYDGYIAARTAVRDVMQEMDPLSVGEYRRPPDVETPPVRRELLTFEESVEAIRPLLGTVIRPNIYLLRDGELMGCLAVDPDVAFAALQAREMQP